MIAINHYNCKLLALVNFAVPLLTIHICLILAMWSGHIPWCLPYIDSCTSISGVGKLFPEYLAFKLGMLPASLFLALLWRQISGRLRELGDLHSRTQLLPALGYAAAGCLFVYAAFLGSWREDQDAIRRTLIIVYFGFSFLCQCLFIGRAQVNFQHSGTLGWMQWTAFFLMLLGLSELVVDSDAEWSAHWFSPIEWWMAQLVHLHYLLLWQLLNQSPSSLDR